LEQPDSSNALTTAVVLLPVVGAGVVPLLFWLFLVSLCPQEKRKTHPVANYVVLLKVW